MQKQNKALFPFSGCDSVLLYNPDTQLGPDANFIHNAGVDSDSTYLVWTKKGGKKLAAPAMNARKCREAGKLPVATYNYKNQIPLLRRMLGSKGRRRSVIGLDFESISAARLARLKKNVPAKYADVSEQLGLLRMKKTKKEIANMRKACAISEKILNSLKFTRSMSELDVVRLLSIACASRGLRFAYSPIVATGKNSALPHHSPTTKKLSGIVLIDFGVKIGGMCADLTRCYFAGKCAGEREKYAEAKKIFYEIVAALPKCKSAGGIASKAGKIIHSHGWPAMIHAVGHGVGLEVHELPRLSPISREKLADGITFAIEPGWYGKKFGVRYENVIVWGKKKAEILL